MRRSRSRPLPLALALAVAAATSPACAQNSAGTPADPAAGAKAAEPRTETTAERSTGQVERAIEPAPPPPAVRLELPAERMTIVRDGTVSAARVAHFSVEPPAGRMIEIRIRSADEMAAFSIFRGANEEPETGTDRASGAVGWISSTESGGELRILVWTTNAAEAKFQLLVRVHPAETPEAPAEAPGASAPSS